MPLYARVSGALPKDDVIGVMTSTRNNRGVFAATQFNSAKGGTAMFTMSGGPIVGAWLNGKPVKLGSSSKLNVAAGVNTLVLQLGDAEPPDVVQLNSSDVSFLAN